MIFLLAQLFVSGMTVDSISERYLWRMSLIRKYNNFRYFVGDRVFYHVLVGKDDWLYFTGDMSIPDYQKTSLINKSKIKRLTLVLKQFDEQVQHYGGDLLVVIPPDKSTVYPQYMPDEVPVIGNESSLDRIVEYIKNNSNVQVLDLRSVMIEQSNTSRVYYKTDSHWNCVGAYYAYNEILSQLEPLHPSLEIHPLDDFEIVHPQHSIMDIVSVMNLDITEEVMDISPKFESILVTVNEPVVGKSPRVVVNKIKDLPNLLVFHDSFYDTCLNKFIEPAFSRTVTIPYNSAEIADYLAIIEAEKPDVLIVEIVERLVEDFLTHLSE